MGKLASTLDKLSFFIEMLRVDTDEAAEFRVRHWELRERVVPALEALRGRLAGLAG